MIPGDRLCSADEKAVPVAKLAKCDSHPDCCLGTVVLKMRAFASFSRESASGPSVHLATDLHTEGLTRVVQTQLAPANVHDKTDCTTRISSEGS